MARSSQRLQLLAKLGDFLFELGEASADGIHVLAAGCAVGHEARAVMDHIDRYRPGRDSHHRLPRRNILGDDRVRADLGALADLTTTPSRSVGWRLPPIPVVGLVPPKVTCW